MASTTRPPTVARYAIWPRPLQASRPLTTAVELKSRWIQGVCCCTPGKLPIDWLDAKYGPGSCCPIGIVALATPKGRELIICLSCSLIARTDCVPIL